MASTNDTEQPWFLKSSFPVLFSFDEAVRKPAAQFQDFLQEQLSNRHVDDAAPEPKNATLETEETKNQPMVDAAQSETFTMVSNSTSGDIRKGFQLLNVEYPASETSDSPEDAPSKEESNLGNMMHTENGDLAYRSANNDLVDLFNDLEEVITGPLLDQRLSAAWKEDPLAALKIIFNARSIHLGKSSRHTFYRCAGWLAQKHPLTLVANLQWLSRPIIEKKVDKKGEEDMVIVDVKDDNDDPSKYDVRNGVAHGYWKDLLNILALAANHKLSPLADPRDVLNSENPGIARGKSASKTMRKNARRGHVARGRGRHHAGPGRASPDDTKTEAEKEAEKKVKKEAKKQKMTEEQKRIKIKEARHQTRDDRHDNAIDTFNSNPVYRTLHLTVARLFAEQLECDLRALHGNDLKAKRTISLCGKWAPTHNHFHDRHTFIVSTIAEILYPRDTFDDIPPTADREEYIRYAREKYRKDTSALRKHLDIVERKITTGNFGDIKYDRVPSLAMNQYSKLFIEKDMDHFDKYIENVAEGKANISGATLLPSTLIKQIRTGDITNYASATDGNLNARQLIEAKMKVLEAKVADGQWKTIVQRIKDSGTLESSIAVCDVSGSMLGPEFPDKTTPMDSSIGLSLLMAEVAKPPFDGAFITFSSEPRVEKVDLSHTLTRKYFTMSHSSWGMTTNFVAVFEDLILPMAVKHKVKQEDMVKRIFVFSDMHFDQARTHDWESRGTSYQRIEKKFQEAGYETPELVFWNLAGGRAGYTANSGDDPTAPKPATVAEEGTCLVSGYSQGMLKVFLDGGSFEDAEDEDGEDEEVVIDKDDNENVTERPKKKAKMDPLGFVKKVIGHKAYDMLRVLD